MTTINESAIQQLFLEAHTHAHWLPKPVDDALLVRLYETLRLAPTSANNQASRIVFVKSPEAKERLKAALAPGNVEKTMTAPVTAIVAYDMEFFEKLPKLMPQVDARSWFAHLPAEALDRIGYQSSSLQGAYLILAARALGLDCGPMGGFDIPKVNAAFFPDGKWRANFLINLGYGDPAKLFPRNPRLDFAEACRIE
jgi:3-hydroxypropanoate dehydrogenase